MDNNDVLIVVLTRIHATGLSVLRSLGEAGYKVDIVASSASRGGSKFVSASKYVGEYSEIITKKVETGGEADLLAELLKYEGMYEKKPVLFPTDDYSASFMDMNREVLSEIFVMPGIVGGGQGSLTEHMDKTYQSRIAEEAGIPVPKAWTISLRDENIPIPEDMVYPCFVKPIESITGLKTEMKRCDDREILETHLQKLRNSFADRDILVQEFLNIDTEISFSGICLDQEIIVPAIIRKIDVAKYETGVAIRGKLCPFEELGELAPKIVKMLQMYRYCGLFDIDLNVCGDKIYYNETNMRSGGSNYAYYMSGINLPEVFVKYMYGEEITPEEKRIGEYGKTFIYETVAWDDYIFGYMTKEELDEKIESADICLLYNDDDPEPGRLFNEKVLAKKERVEARMAAKEEHIKTVMAATGWSYEEAVADMDKANAEGDVSYLNYVRFRFWKIREADRPAAYDMVSRAREFKKRRREKYVQKLMNRTYRTHEEAEAILKEARERLGISYRDYVRNKFWMLTEEQQLAAMPSVEAKKADRIDEKEEYVRKVMAAAGLEFEDAKNMMRDAKNRTGITFKNYEKFKFWELTEEQQEQKSIEIESMLSTKVRRFARRVRRKIRSF